MAYTPKAERRRLRGGRAALLAVFAGVVGLSANAASATSAKQPIIIGLAIAQTGAFAQFDGPPIAGLKMEIANLNKRGGVLGRPVKFVVADTHSDPAKITSAALNVIGKGANVVITTCDFDFGAPAAVAAQKKGLLAFSTCAGSLDFGPRGIGHLAFTMGAPAEAQGATMAEFAYARLHLRHPYVLLDDTIAFEKELCGAFVSRWQQLAGKGSIVGQDTFKQTDPSISGQIANIQSSRTKPDFIYQCSYSPGNAQALRQLRAAGITVPVLAEQTFDGNGWKAAVPNATNLYFPSNGSIYGDDPDPAVNAFFRSFKQFTGSTAPNGLAVTGYSAMQAIAIAMTRAKSTGGTALANQLEQFRNVPLLAGKTSFTKTWHIPLHRELRVMKVTKGRTTFVTLWAPKVVPTKVG